MKYNKIKIPRTILSSRPAWGAWIEMELGTLKSELKLVAPRMGRVD